MPNSPARRASEGGFTLLEVLFAAASVSVMFFGVAGILVDGSRAQGQAAQSFYLRSRAAMSLRRIARELEQSSTACPSFSVAGGVTFNLPVSVGETTVWGPPITYRVTTQNRLVREQSGSSVTIMEPCVSLGATVTGQRVNLRLSAEGALERDGTNTPRKPRFQEQLDVVVLP